MKDQPVEEVKSLVGKIDKSAMGEKSSRSKPNKEKKKTKPTKKNENWELKEKFDETIYYRPKTKENKLIYENYLGKIYELVQDQPPELLQAIADEILAIIRSSDIEESKKRIEAETLVGAKIPEDTFIDLCNVTKSLSDYAMEVEEGLNEIVAINEDDDEEEDDSDNAVVEEEEV